MTLAQPAILYIHGFNSSPLSQKASQLSAAMQRVGLAERLRVPELHHHPRRAIGHYAAAFVSSPDQRRCLRAEGRAYFTRPW